jgi:hypothetical protein
MLLVGITDNLKPKSQYNFDRPDRLFEKFFQFVRNDVTNDRNKNNPLHDDELLYLLPKFVTLKEPIDPRYGGPVLTENVQFDILYYLLQVKLFPFKTLLD